MKKVVSLIDWILFFLLAPFAIIFFVLTAIFGKKAPDHIENSGNKRIFRFVSSNLEAVRKWKLESISLTNLNGFFSKSIIVFFPNVIEENGFYQEKDIDFYQFSQHPNTIIKSIGLRKTNALVTWFSSLYKVFTLAKKEKVSVLLAQDPHYLGGNAFLLSRLLGIPYVIHIVTNYEVKDRPARGLAFPPFMFLAIELFIERFIYRNALFVSSSYENYKEYALSHGADSSKTYSLGATCNEIHFKEVALRKNVKEELGISADKKVLLYVGRFAAVKSSLDLIKCFHLVEKQESDSVLVLVGSGPLEGEMIKLAKELNTFEKIKIFPAKSQDELVDIYSSSDVVLCSHAGVTLIEAALSLTPIVAYDYEWHSELIGKNDERGYLVPYRNYKQMAEKALFVLSNKDKALSKARKAREYAEEKCCKEKVMTLEKELFEKYVSSGL